MLRFGRIFLLAWAILLAPQISLVHALSHLPANLAAQGSADTRQQAPDKVCDSCLALAQLGAALPSQPTWCAGSVAALSPPATTPHAIALEMQTAFLARGPPLALS